MKDLITRKEIIKNKAKAIYFILKGRPVIYRIDFSDARISAIQMALQIVFKWMKATDHTSVGGNWAL